MQDHRTRFGISAMCRVLQVHRSGFYRWAKRPVSKRAVANQRLVGQIGHYWNESDRAYGSPRVYRDLREAGETCGQNRVARLMRVHGIRAHHRLSRRRYRPGRPAHAAPNRLRQDFTVRTPNTVLATDITHIRTLEGWLYVAVVMDLCSRRIVGWSMQSTMHRDLVIQALLAAKWQRHPARCGHHPPKCWSRCYSDKRGWRDRLGPHPGKRRPGRVASLLGAQ